LWAVYALGDAIIPSPENPDWKTTIFSVYENPVAMVYDGERLWVLHFPADSWDMSTILPIDPGAGLADYSLSPPTRVGDACMESSDNRARNVLYLENTRKLWVLFPRVDARYDDYPENLPFVQSLDPDRGLLHFLNPVGWCSGYTCPPSSAFGTDGSNLWASSDNQLWSIDTSNGSAYAPNEIGFSTSGMMVYDGACLWMKGEDGAIAINPGSGDECPGAELASTLPADALAFDGRRIWGAGSGKVMALDLLAETIVWDVKAGSSPSALAFDGALMWVANKGDNTIQGVDPDTGSVGDPLPVGEGPGALLFDGARLWVLNMDGQSVQYIDPSTYHIDNIIQPSATPSPTITTTPTITPLPTKPSFERELSLTTPEMEGDDVIDVQLRLLELGYFEVGSADGVFGVMTDAAVRHFQEDNGLLVDGVVGPVTWDALFDR